MKQDKCWVDSLTLQRQENERCQGFAVTLELAQSLMEDVVARKRITKHEMEHRIHGVLCNIFTLAHLNGYIDCEGNWIGKRPRRRRIS
jgi:hypothetical protein